MPVLEDDGHVAMRGFYEHVARLLRGRARDHVRIAFYGDSNVVLDLITGPMRRTIQKQLGDGGHGYVAVGRPWKWYEHSDIKVASQGPWMCLTPPTVRLKDMGYGIAGIVSTCDSFGSTATYATAESGSPVGLTASRFGVMYGVEPKGGSFEIHVDGTSVATVDTSRGQDKTGYEVVRVQDGPHRFQLTDNGKQPIRLYGVAVEREQPGAVLDMLGITGIGFHDLARLNEAINESILRKRPYDLILFLVGTNSFTSADNADAIKRLAEFHRRINPEISLLVMSQPDHTKTNMDSSSDHQTAVVAEGLHKAALENRCAFWDFRGAMGGEGSMARFFHKGLAAKDLYHLTRTGGAFMGDRVVHAIWTGLAQYLRENPKAGCSD